MLCREVVLMMVKAFVELVMMGSQNIVAFHGEVDFAVVVVFVFDCKQLRNLHCQSEAFISLVLFVNSRKLAIRLFEFSVLSLCLSFLLLFSFSQSSYGSLALCACVVHFHIHRNCSCGRSRA